MTRIDADALWTDLMALGEITDPDRPYTRRSFSPRFLQGRAWLTRRMRAAGLATHIDAAGNLIGRRAGRDPNAGVIVVGSHSDSVPSGGRFDGMTGVLAGLSIARALDRDDVELDSTLEVIDFLAEEPSEFGLSCIGSRALCGALDAEHLAARNEHGETLGQAIGRMGGDPARMPAAVRRDIIAAFELHIEQGPVLEREAIDLGIVTAIVGITRIEVVFRGTAGHAGTTPMSQRRDPLMAAAALIGWIQRTAIRLEARAHGHFVATVGIVEAKPGASNVIAKTARLVVDARSEQRDLMDEFLEALAGEATAAAAAAQVERTAFRVLSDTSAARCAAHLRQALSDQATLLGFTHRAMASGAGHDMAFLARIAPMAMLFIPCKQGRSHTPEEWAEPAAIAAGTDVLLATVLAMA